MAFTLNRRLAQLVDSNGQLNTGKIPNDYITSDHVADNTITAAMLHTSFTVSTSNLTAIDTDDVSEGTSNLYFTNARARGAVSATGSLSYNSSTGVFSFTQGDTDTVSEGSTNLYFTTARVDSHLSGGTGVTYSSGTISIGQDVGTTATPTFGNITTTGYIAGPATFTIDPAAVGDNTGTVVIAGNLQVDGTTTTINSTTVNVDDLNIQLATGAANAAAADGAGITVDGASATITYDGTTDKWDFNKFIEIGSGYGGTPNIESQLVLNDSGNNYITIGSGASSEGGILFADSGDNDVGVISYNHSTNSLGFRTNGVSNRMIIDSSGDVGIGIASPDFKLQVAGALGLTNGGGLHLLPTDASDTDAWILYQYSDNTLRYNFTGAGADEIIIKYPNATNATTLLIDTEQQRVGVGTDSPSQALHVAGSGSMILNDSTNWSYLRLKSPNTNGGYIQFADADDDDVGQIFYYHGLGGDYMSFTTNAAEAMRIDGSGNVGIGETTPDAPLHITSTTPIIVFDESDASQEYRIGSFGGAFALYDSTDAAYRLTVDGSGNVGIGTTNPSARLHIQPANSDTLATAIFTRQNNAAGTDGNTFSLRNDAANNFVEMNSGGTNNGGYKFYTGTFSGDSVFTIVGAGSNGGNVGIGVSSPTARLELDNPSSFTNMIEYGNVTWNQNTGHGLVAVNRGSDGYVQLQLTSGVDDADVFTIRNSGTGANVQHNLLSNGNVYHAGNVGIGVASPGYDLTVSSQVVVGDAPAGLSGNTIHVKEGSTSGIHFPLIIGGGTHVAGAAFGLAFDPEGYGNRNKIAILAEGIGAGYSRGRLHFALDSANDSGQVTLAESKMCILENGNVGIGAQLDNAGHKLHIWGGGADTVLAVTTNDNYKSELRLMEDKAGTTHGGYIRYDGNGDYVQIGHYNSGSDTNAISIDDSGNVGLGVTNPAGHFEVHGGRMGIVSTDSSWEQLRVCNTSTTGEAGIAIFNGANATEFLSDTQPIFSNAFTLAINPYGCGSDTLAIGHGNLGDSIWHIDGSGNFGYGPNTENPLTYYEISKTRPNVNAPSDYELKMTLNTYGYCGSNYKLAMLQFVGGDTASAQDNFYAALSARTVNGANNQEDGALQFHVKTAGSSDTLAAEFNGDNNPASQIAGGGSVRNGLLFRWQGIAIDRSWGNYPGIAVMNSSDYSTAQGAHAEFRVHGTNGSSASYPSLSGSDFSVDFRVDGAYIQGSDRRRKTNITTIDSALDKVKQLTGKRFQTINRAGEVNEQQSKADNYKFGLIAQEVEDIIPEAIKYYADEDDGTEGWNSSYSIDYPSLTALLINAIKEQDIVIQDLKTRIETLEG